MRSAAKTVEEYLNSLPPERYGTIKAVRKVILDNLPKGYVESIRWGMITYEIPLERYPDTYNKQPLMYAALASQKRYISLYLMNVFVYDDFDKQFRERYIASGKKLDMAKSCVRFKKLEDLPLELKTETIARTPVDEYIKRYEQVYLKNRKA